MLSKGDLEKKTRIQFNQWSRYYDNDLLWGWYFEHSIKRVLSLIVPKRDDMILDLGCGTGNLGIALSGYVNKCYGIDISDKMINVAKRKQINYKIAEDKLKYITGKADQIDFPSSYFDFVFCLNSFHHYVSHDDVLREIYRILKPDGILVLLDPFLNNLLRRLWIIFLNRFFHEPYVKYHTQESLQFMLNKNGFYVIEQQTFLYFTLLSIIKKVVN